jgi:threonine dehydrogenase-like Zn-dependent dehydrogenase
MQMIGEKRVDLAPMISHKLPFARSQEAFELATKRKGECIKIVVDFEEKKIVR